MTAIQRQVSGIQLVSPQVDANNVQVQSGSQNCSLYWARSLSEVMTMKARGYRVSAAKATRMAILGASRCPSRQLHFFWGRSDEFRSRSAFLRCVSSHSSFS